MVPANAELSVIAVKFIGNVFLLFMLVPSFGCMAEPRRIIKDIGDLKNVGVQQEVPITLKGYFWRAELGGARLFARDNLHDETQVENFVDLVPGKHGNTQYLDNVTSGCQLIEGRFRAYSDDFYGSGNLTSGIGIVYVDSYEACP